MEEHASLIAETTSIYNEKSEIFSLPPIMMAKDARGATVFGSVVNFTKTTVGAGVLSLPYAVSKLGLGLGLV